MLTTSLVLTTECPLRRRGNYRDLRSYVYAAIEFFTPTLNRAIVEKVLSDAPGDESSISPLFQKYFANLQRFAIKS